MIPFGSQRASGQDLATHLLNAQDNELLELAHVRGAIARELHGAFAEWEAQARALTRCRKYLYSLSVNPDPRQGNLTREQYFDYIARVEERLGLTDQPRAIVFHVKYGRAHCHVVWSRIDAANKRAVQISFDREKLMAVTREFARDHGLKLPDGYYRDRDAPREKNRQLSLYEKHQQDVTGITKEERIANVTAAWRQSDSARAFVQALEELGYILATGKRDYVLVDRFGEMNSLPKLVSDKEVRTRQVRELLGKDFPTADLPSVDEARALAAQRREAVAERQREQQQRDEHHAQEVVRRAALELKQQSRRQTVERQAANLATQQKQERKVLSDRQRIERAMLRSSYLDEMRQVRQERARRRPTGLAAFLARVSGIALVTKKLHRYRDRERFRAFLAGKTALHERQIEERGLLARRHQMQVLDRERRQRAVAKIERREQQALETALLREARIKARNEPPVAIPDDRGRDRKAASAFRQEWNDHADPASRPGRKIDLRAQFGRAAADDDGGDESGGEKGAFDAPQPTAETTARRRRRRIDLEQEFNDAANPKRRRGSDTSGGPAPPDNKFMWEDEADFEDDWLWDDEPDELSDEEIDAMVWDDSYWENEKPDDEPPAPRPTRKRKFRPKQ